MVELVIRRAIAANQENAITKQDFLSQAAKTSRYSLFTPMEADIIFHFAAVDSNGSGRLSLDDFEKILDPRWRPITQQEQQRLAELGSQQKAATGGEKEKHGFLWEVIGNMYSFTLGSIAGAVGATAVYPIDLVKTRMQNQRSKVVGELLYKNSLDCFRKVVKNEGFVGLYRGLGPQLVVSWFFC
jgi:solute carrier family 25 aspartate/glutamate transporter 12/13